MHWSSHGDQISDICEGAVLKHGHVVPVDVIEGSVVTVICSKDFKVAGPWELMCKNGTWGQMITEGKTQCVPIRSGNHGMQAIT